MLRVRTSLALFAAMLVAVASWGQPGFQSPFGAPAQPGPLSVTMLPGIDDPAIVAELKLEEEQVKALVAHRQANWDEAYTTAPKKYTEGAPARGEATEAILKKTLDEAQYKRLVQIAAQNALSRGGFGEDGPTINLSQVNATILRRYPELVTAFKLTDAQKKQLDAPVGKGAKGDRPPTRTVTLTKEQAVAAKEFLGTTFATNWRPKSDPRIAAQPVAPTSFTLLDAKDVRADVRLTDEQRKSLTALEQKWEKLAEGRRMDLSPKEADTQAAVLKTETEKALTDTLKPDQLTRLKQIAFQSSVAGRFGRSFGTPVDFHIEQAYSHPTVSKELAIDEAQAGKFKAMWESFRADAGKALEKADTSAAAEKQLKEMVESRRTKAETILTKEQRDKLAELAGKPFTGSTQPDRPTFFQSPITQNIRAGSFGKYGADLAYLADNKAIQAELKLDEKQIKQAAAARDEVAAMPRPALPSTVENAKAYAEAMGERSKKIEAAIGTILDEKQAKRFRELMLQAREKPPEGPAGRNPTAIPSAAAYPGVAQAVNLSEEQKQQLIRGGDPATVLTDAQKKSIKDMLGETFKGDLALPGPGNRPTYASTPANASRHATFGNHTDELAELAGNKAIQEELTLKVEQIKKAVELRDEVAKIVLPRLGPTTIDEYTKAYGERSKKVEEAIGKILDADQAKRFREVMMQFRERPVSGPGIPFATRAPVASAISYPGVAKELNLTDEQRTRMVTGAAPATVLSDEQKSAITKLLGTPFKGLPLAGAGTPRPTATPFMRAMTLNRAALEETLKLSEEQSKKLKAAWDAYQAALKAIPEVGTVPAAERTRARNAAREAFDKAAAGLLNAEQQKRMEQIAVQFNAASNLGTTLTGPEVAKALALTPDQTKKITTLGEDAVKFQTLISTNNLADSDEKLALRLRDAADGRMLALLTDSQKAKWKELTGEAFPGIVKTIPRRGFGGPGGAGGGFGGIGGGGFGGPFEP